MDEISLTLSIGLTIFLIVVSLIIIILLFSINFKLKGLLSIHQKEEQIKEGDVWVCPDCGTENPGDIYKCTECNYSIV